MATLSSIRPTLLDLAKRTDPDGSISTVIEILNETNEILDDIVFVEGNLPTGHRTTIRSGLPTPTWRQLYGGVQPTKSRTVQVTDNCGMLEAYAEVDKALADMNAGRPAFYMDRTTRSWVRRQVAAGVQNSTLSMEDFGGKQILAYNGIPLRRVDALAADEARIV
jgi:hypothetical protein